MTSKFKLEQIRWSNLVKNNLIEQTSTFLPKKCPKIVEFDQILCRIWSKKLNVTKFDNQIWNLKNWNMNEFQRIRPSLNLDVHSDLHQSCVAKPQASIPSCRSRRVSDWPRCRHTTDPNWRQQIQAWPTRWTAASGPTRTYSRGTRIRRGQDWNFCPINVKKGSSYYNLFLWQHFFQSNSRNLWINIKDHLAELKCSK